MGLAAALGHCWRVEGGRGVRVWVMRGGRGVGWGAEWWWRVTWGRGHMTEVTAKCIL